MKRNQKTTTIENTRIMRTNVMKNSKEALSHDIYYMLSNPNAFQEIRESMMEEINDYCGKSYNSLHWEERLNLVDETIIKLWEHRDKYCPEMASVKTWANSIVRNRVISYITFLNGKTKLKRVNLDFVDGMGKGLDGNDGEMDVERIENYCYNQSSEKREMTDEEIIREEYFHRVQRVYDSMDEKDQKMFVMLYDEYGNEEIADALEMKKGAVATMKSRWKKRYFQQLAA